MQRINKVENFRFVLLNSLAERKCKNPAYSQRAFAAHLKISPGTLSDIISGRKTPSGKLANKLSEQLCLSPAAKASFIQSACESSQLPRLMAPEVKPKDYRKIEMDQFQLISEWYHYAIIGLSTIPNNKASSRWIASKLGITKPQAKQAMNRLVRMQIIKIEGRSFRQVGEGFTTGEEIPSAAVRKYHDQNLDLARKSLHSDRLEERGFGSVTVGIDPSNLKKAKSEIVKFRKRMAKLLSTGMPQRVYTLSIQLFPLDKLEVKPKSRFKKRRRK